VEDLKANYSPNIFANWRSANRAMNRVVSIVKILEKHIGDVRNSDITDLWRSDVVII
jgi:hypothetical protein